jgi:predicted nuclease of restriction endonuclease-like (RecB) superfamily
VSAKLSWSHYILLLSLSNNESRYFYQELAIQGALSVRELERQINSMLFERQLLNKERTDLKLAPKMREPEDQCIVKDLHLQVGNSELALAISTTMSISFFIT